uniref:BTB domain-containing protein n=1 Tax=Globodera pallida TaxID=36090 RepID=A0A183BSS6_GLOPA
MNFRLYLATIISNFCSAKRKLFGGADKAFVAGVPSCGRSRDEKELLPAHKAILEKASDSVLTRQMKRPPPPPLGPHVKVPDVEVDAFKAMLVFIYADDLSGLNGDNAISVLYAAK